MKRLKNNKNIKRGIITVLSMSAIIGIALWAIMAFAATDFKSPTACGPLAPSIGRFNCENAFADGGSVASSTPVDNHNISVWYNYNFNVPSSAVVDVVVVRVDAAKNPAATQNGNLLIRVSKDFGTSWGPIHTVPLTSTTEQTFLVDVSSDFSWLPVDFD